MTISFPLKRAGASEHSDKVQAAANESKPTGEITPTEARNLRLQKDYSNCTQEPKKKKKKKIFKNQEAIQSRPGNLSYPSGPSGIPKSQWSANNRCSQKCTGI